MADTDNKDELETKEFSFDEDDFEYTEENVSSPGTESVEESPDTGDGSEGGADDAVEEDSDLQSEEDTEPETKTAIARKLGEFMKKIRVPLIIFCALLLGAAIGMFAYSLSRIDENHVMDNVYIEKLNVGGLTYDETLAAVNATYLFENSELTLTDGKTTFTINGADIGLTALPEETAKKALDYCKSDNVFKNAFNSCMLLFNEHIIVPAPQVDEEKLTEKLNECGNSMLGERIQHYAEFNEENIATIHSGQTGYDGDPSAAKEQVLTSMNNESFSNIHVDFKAAPPDEMTVERLDLLIYKDPVDARYEVNGNDVSIAPSVPGRYIDKEAVAPLVESIYEGCEPVAVPYLASEPAVSTQTLQDKLFANTLASYSTNYGGSTWNRCQNVARAASLISGTVIASGEVFSFNDTVGHRSTENGFYTAKEYVNGESVDGIGGGTCQVSSTLYSAVLYADMGIVERLNHMMSVGYIPLGQDATVSDGGVDFKFRNTSDYPVKISAYTDGSTITVSIIGTAWEPAREVKISNVSSSVGENTVVRSTRYVYSGGQLISTDTLNSSTYMPHKKAAATAAAASASSSSSSSSSSSYSNDDDDYDDSGDDDYDSSDDDE